MSELIKPSRRGFLSGLGAIIAAPAIVRASSLMKIKPLILEDYIIHNHAYTHLQISDHWMDAMRYAFIPGIKSYENSDLVLEDFGNL